MSTSAVPGDATVTTLVPARRNHGLLAGLRQHQGVVLCLVAASAGGASAVFATKASDFGLGVASMLTWRFVVAAIVLWGVVAIRRPSLPSARVAVKLFLLGAAGFALQAGLYFSALSRIDAATAGLLLYVYPVLVVGIGLLFRNERFGRRKGVAITCSVIGMLLLMGSGLAAGTLAPAGVALALGAALTYAIYVTLTDTLPSNIDGYLAAALICTGAMTSIGLCATVTGNLHAPASIGAWFWVAMLALVSTVLLNLAFLAGVRHVGASTAALLSCIEPVVTAVSMMLVSGDAFGIAQIAGGASVLAGVAALQVKVPARLRWLASRPTAITATGPALIALDAEAA